jgi:hypothetical protein
MTMSLRDFRSIRRARGATINAVFLSISLLFATAYAKADTIVAINAESEFPNLDITQDPTPGMLSFQISYDWDVTTNALVPGTLLYETAGLLGPFSLYAAVNGDLDLIDSNGDLLQVDFSDFQGINGLTFPDLGSYTLEDLDLIYHQSQVPGSTLLFAGPGGSLTVSATPEPSMAWMLLFGIPMLLWWRGSKYKRY